MSEGNVERKVKKKQRNADEKKKNNYREDESKGGEMSRKYGDYRNKALVKSNERLWNKLKRDKREERFNEEFNQDPMIKKVPKRKELKDHFPFKEKEKVRPPLKRRPPKRFDLIQIPEGKKSPYREKGPEMRRMQQEKQAKERDQSEKQQLIRKYKRMGYSNPNIKIMVANTLRKKAKQNEQVLKKSQSRFLKRTRRQ